jgi:peptidyl-prolyl cis-trans isomerase C
MLKGLTFLPIIVFAAGLTLPAMADEAPNPETVVARVNGDEITLGHMIVAHAGLPQQYQQLPADVLYNAILDQLIQQAALTQVRSGDIPKHVRLSLENEQRSLLAADEIERVMAGAATDDRVQAAYEEAYADGFGAQEYDASHILVETEDEAKALKAEIDAGADFATLAQEKSTGPSGPNGGSLGWFADGAMVPEFQAAVAALQPGQVSAPVQTQFGWHVIKLNDTRKAAAPALDDVREELAQKIRQDAVEAKIEELTREAAIDRPTIEGLNPEILRDLDLVRN